jgi:CPA2 family monovalent cation:H+ antiporter-2
MISVMSNVLLFFGIAGLVVPLLQHLKMSSVLAYLMCGVAIGPYGLAALSDAHVWLGPFVIKEAQTVQMLGEFGIMTLMFMLGLELSLERLYALKHFILGLGSLQVWVTGIVIFFIARGFHNTVQASVLIGASFSLSSTAVVMQLLEEYRLSKHLIGRLCFSILLMQDLAVIPVLILAALLPGSQSTGVITTLLVSLVVGIVSVFLIFIVGKKCLKPVLRSVSVFHNPEWLFAFTVFLVVMLAVITDMAGLSLALGAFLAGLLIAETEFCHEVQVIINPIKGLLLGIFFLSIGMIIDVTEILRYPFLLLISVFGIFAIKMIVLFPLCRLFGVSATHSAEVALYLAQPGEFALLVLGAALSSGLIPISDVQFFLLVTAIAMVLSPLLFQLGPRVGRWMS